jgi:hypothetical protein
MIRIDKGKAESMRRRWWLLIGLAMLLAACAGESGGDPAQMVQDYLQAKISVDRATIARLLCAEQEANLDREALSFDGVEASLQDVACTYDAAAGSVTCTGVIAAVYGGEVTDFPLGTYRVVEEAGEWRWCGEVGQ